MYTFCVQLYMRFHFYSNRPFITYQKKMAGWVQVTPSVSRISVRDSINFLLDAFF